jgi:uncharacterized membrane protein YgcG
MPSSAQLAAVVLALIVRATALFDAPQFSVLEPRDGRISSDIAALLDVTSGDVATKGDRDAHEAAVSKRLLNFEDLRWPAHVRPSGTDLEMALLASGRSRSTIAALDSFWPNSTAHLRGAEAAKTHQDALATMNYARLRLIFISAWTDAAAEYLRQADAVLSEQRARAQSLKAQLAGATAAVVDVATAASAGGSGNGTAGGLPPTDGPNYRQELNSHIRPEAAALADKEAALRSELAAVSAAVATSATLREHLHQEHEIWDYARRRAMQESSRAAAEAAAADAARADLERLIAIGQNIGQALAAADVPAPTPRPRVGAVAADAAAAASAVLPSDLCPDVAACAAQEAAFAASATVNFNRGAAAALALLALNKGRMTHAKFAKLPILFNQLGVNFKGQVLASVVAMFVGKESMHPGGSLAFLCFHADLRLRDRCAGQVIDALKAAKMTDLSLVIECMIRAQNTMAPSKLGILLGPGCMKMLKETATPANEMCEGMMKGVSNLQNEIGRTLKGIMAALAEAQRVKALAVALAAAATTPFAFPTSVATANSLVVEYTYYGRRDARYALMRKQRKLLLTLHELARAGSLDPDDVLAGQVGLDSGSPLAKSIAKESLAYDAAGVKLTAAQEALDKAQQDWLAIQGKAMPKPSAEDLQAAATAEAAAKPIGGDAGGKAAGGGGDEGGDAEGEGGAGGAAGKKAGGGADSSAPGAIPKPKRCPFGNPFCPALPDKHQAFWDTFNALKGGWKPKGIKDPTWKGADPPEEGADGAAAFLELGGGAGITRGTAGITPSAPGSAEASLFGPSSLTGGPPSMFNWAQAEVAAAAAAAAAHAQQPNADADAGAAAAAAEPAAAASTTSAVAPLPQSNKPAWSLRASCGDPDTGSREWYQLCEWSERAAAWQAWHAASGARMLADHVVARMQREREQEAVATAARGAAGDTAGAAPEAAKQRPAHAAPNAAAAPPAARLSVQHASAAAVGIGAAPQAARQRRQSPGSKPRAAAGRVTRSGSTPAHGAAVVGSTDAGDAEPVHPLLLLELGERRDQQALQAQHSSAGGAGSRSAHAFAVSAPTSASRGAHTNSASGGNGGGGASSGGAGRVGGSSNGLPGAGGIRPSTDADLYPNLYFPRTARRQRKRIDEEIRRRDAGLSKPLNLGGGFVPPQPLVSRGELPAAAKAPPATAPLPPLAVSDPADGGEHKVKFPPPPPGSSLEAPLPFGKGIQFPPKVGSQIMMPPLPPTEEFVQFADSLQLLSVPLPPTPMPQGYVVRERHLLPGGKGPALAFDVVLKSGTELPFMPPPLLLPGFNIFQLPPMPAMPSLPMGGEAPEPPEDDDGPPWPPQTGWVNKAWVDLSGPRPKVNPATVLLMTAPIPGITIKCLFLGLFCQPVPGLMDPPFVLKMLLNSMQAAVTLMQIPGDLYVQAAGYECDCLCPVPRNPTLGAEDCGLLAAQLAHEEAQQDAEIEATSDAMEAGSRFRLLETLAQSSAQLGGPRIPFPDPDPPGMKKPS